MNSAPDPRLVRDACMLALDVAFDGERADPPVAAPPGLRQMFGFRKLTKTSIATIARAIDQDDDFRARVAAEATEESVGLAGLLWLTRPDGWDSDPVWTAEANKPDPAAVAKLRREREGAEAKVAQLRQAVEDAEAGRQRAVEQLGAVRQRAEAAEAERDEALGQLAAIFEERNSAVRSLKETEAELATTRRDLRVARNATREAEADRFALQEKLTGAKGRDGGMSQERSGDATSGDATSAAADRGAGGHGNRRPAEPFDRTALRRAVQTASSAAEDLARALDEASMALDPPAPTERPRDRSAPAGPPRPTTTTAARPRSARKRPVRRVQLPPGIIEGTPEADRHLVTTSDALLLVDGYNLARARWSGITPEEERRRTVRLLEEAQARSGARVIVIFDGASNEVSPVASRVISVRYSPTGVTADDLILDVLADLPVDQPVLVVSSDREVADGARDEGATVLGSAAFLAATDR